MSTLRITLKQTVSSDQLRNVYYVAGAYAIQANAQAIVDYFRLSYNQGGSSEKLVDRMSTGWQLYGADVKDVSDPDNPVIPYVFTLGVMNGLDSGERLPLQNCMLVQFEAVAAPPNRSRKYLGAWTEAAHQSSGWTSGAVTAASNYCNYLLDMETNLDTGVALVVARFNAGVYVGSNLLTQYQISPYARTQRRRTPGRGA